MNKIEIQDTQIIIDHGSYYTKYGYSGYNKPHNKIRSKLYKHKVSKVILTHNQVLKNNISLKDLFTITVIKNSVIINFEYIVPLWDSIFNDLNANTSMCNLLIIDPLYVPADYHDKIIDIMKNKYKFKKIEFYNQQLLGLYGSCSDKGIVIDMGHDCTRIVPIFDSYILLEAVVLFSVCRSLYNKCLMELTNKKNPNFQDMLFNPGDFAIQDMNLVDALVKCIKQTPIDLRRRLCQNVIIIGGGSMMKDNNNFCARLKKMVEEQINGMELRVTMPMSRNVITWLGGSMLCSLQSNGCKNR